MRQIRSDNRRPPLGLSHPLIWTPSASKRRLVAFCVSFSSAVLWSIPALAAGVECHLKADAEPVEVEVLVDGKDHWHAKMQKGETRTLTVPEGSFTVVSKVYNPNLKNQEDIRTDAHTRMCTQQVALSVPLFPQER